MHTKGQWKAVNQRSKDGKDLGWIIEVTEGRGGRIGWSSRGFADTNKEEDRGGPEVKSNAYLMAAAPELLEAVKKSYASLTTAMTGEEFDAVVQQCYAAIQKAQGNL